MKRRLMFCLMVMSGVCPGVSQESRGTLSERAYQEFRDENFAAAERDFRELTKLNPSDVHAQAYLGHALFRREKFTEALDPYERALDLERNGTKLSEEDHRILVDQLAMSYGMGGQINKARLLLEDAIHRDPDYPLNYYNLACAFAEEGDKGRMLANLDLAFKRKANVLKGEQMPDPRSDSSFQKYARDPDFVSLMKKLGY